MLEIQNFTIDKCDDCFRITRNDVDGDLHTHIKSYKLAQTIISNVCNKKILSVALPYSLDLDNLNLQLYYTGKDDFTEHVYL